MRVFNRAAGASNPAWHTMAAEEVVQELGSDPVRGLSDRAAAEGLRAYGPNQIAEAGVRSVWLILWDQFATLMVIILIIAALGSVIVGDTLDAAAIAAIVALNAALGFIQEHRAENAIAALRSLAVPTVRVRRDGEVRDVPATTLVPGDVVLVEAGNQVAADGRVLVSASLRVQEAALTGESEPGDKDSGALNDPSLALADRSNVLFAGTSVVYGRGEFIVTETGMRTELGRIAGMLETVPQTVTPLRRQLDRLGRTLAIAALAIVAIVFTLGVARGEDLRLMLLVALSMAVAAVPEGLPAVVTISLARGAQQMLRRHALIRKLAAVESLGAVTVICSDKTGTLTENRMTVVVLDVADQRIDLAEDDQENSQASERGSRSAATAVDQPAIALLLAGGVLCNDAQFQGTGSRPTHPVSAQVLGDPTEAALLVVATRLALNPVDLRRTFPRLTEIPFDSVRKRMTTVHALPDSTRFIPNGLGPVYRWTKAESASAGLAFTKGSVDGLLDVSSAVWESDHPVPLDAAWRKRIEATHDQLARAGLRVLGVAFRPLLRPGSPEDQIERDLILIGLVGMIDPPRPEARAAIRACQSAGIRPVMITGDHPLTAMAIARDLGIAVDQTVLTGRDLDRLTISALSDVANQVTVYARVSPEDKLKIVQALQARRQVVAMTGDGVNDAPALRQSDVGVAMGIAGTDVAKAAADVVLLDDNFATIVAAVAEGRVIGDNIRKVVAYLMTTNASELAVMLIGPLIGIPLPLLPLQLLWVNLVTDGLPALALGTDPAEPGVLRRPPRPRDAPILSEGMPRHIVLIGLLMALTTLTIGSIFLQLDHPGWQTMVLTVLAFSQLGHALTVRWRPGAGFLKNRPLLGAVALTVLLQLLLIYVGPLQQIFSTVALSASELLVCLGASVAVSLCAGLEIWLSRRGVHRH